MIKACVLTSHASSLAAATLFTALLATALALAAPEPVAQLAWLQGMLARRPAPRRDRCEQWTAPAGGTMLGTEPHSQGRKNGGA